MWKSLAVVLIGVVVMLGWLNRAGGQEARGNCGEHRPHHIASGKHHSIRSLSAACRSTQLDVILARNSPIRSTMIGTSHMYR